MFALQIGGCIFLEIGLKIRFPITRPHICEAFFFGFKIRSNSINKFKGTDPILVKKSAPIKFQKIPTVKNVKLIALRKSISKVFINSIVTSNPVPEEIEPFSIPIRKIKIKNLIL